MRALLKWMWRLFALAVVLAAVAFVHVWYFKPYKIDWFYTRVVSQFMIKSPQMLSSMRILPAWADFYSDDLDDVSVQRGEQMAARLKSDLATLRSYDRTAFDRAEQLSYDTFEFFIANQVDGDRFRDQNFPVNQMFGVQSSLPNFMAQTHQINKPRDADGLHRPLDQFPRSFAR